MPETDGERFDGRGLRFLFLAGISCPGDIFEVPTHSCGCCRRFNKDYGIMRDVLQKGGREFGDE